MAVFRASTPSRPSDYGAVDPMRALVDVACFFVELAMLALLAVSGWRLGDGALIGIALALLYPALAVVVWSVFLARAAQKRLHNPWRYVLELVLFGATTVAAIEGDLTVFGIAFAVLSSVAFGLSALLGETPPHGAHHAGPGSSSSS